MRFTAFLTISLCGLFLPHARAEVTEATDTGFVSEHRLVLKATPGDAYRALVEDVHQWWDASHSFGGDPAGFSIDDVAGGCFCETTDTVSVAHLRVVNVERGRSITLRGGLGPLQAMAVTGSMSFRFEPLESGSELVYRYVVGGYTPGGLKSLAEPVDRVQLGQLKRLQRYIDSGRALN